MTKQDIGRLVTFRGYDDKDYDGRIVALRKGILVVEYAIRLRSGAVVQAKTYLEKPDWGRAQVKE